MGNKRASCKRTKYALLITREHQRRSKMHPRGNTSYVSSAIRISSILEDSRLIADGKADHSRPLYSTPFHFLVHPCKQVFHYRYKQRKSIHYRSLQSLIKDFDEPPTPNFLLPTRTYSR
ncbi:hypothetical protein AVEN_175552-1 [Araneus ventricosus]|uniref:Uncharacterized protein n=1 Tax=Araneus ventricosus TaxID=182803 RepID=A0A4Y2CPM7_ARAVE|nr:hypothetical protein AVEN_175552-1 [Araneus ventricosus]